MDSFHLVSKEASIIFFHQLLAFSLFVRSNWNNHALIYYVLFPPGSLALGNIIFTGQQEAFLCFACNP